ncbi:hypothetical protein SeMB42_g02198 [Synchytrium endobioticum]|uniref:Protein kinase domain-containing protein n=1 Tax=Synchytrium endobioticum TaxID=286115 RepID=A0A507DI57_9FUNG|nr:hypothetical protein SeLEV6574_g04382 [Synchytrium endobioticum]TPX50578.1 hypothetical protein SeMB42_g02198 [Synchytrium endobioticum]
MSIHANDGSNPTIRSRTTTPSKSKSIFNSKPRSHNTLQFTSDIADYELLHDVGGVDDISYLYMARYIPTRELVALKYTDLTLSPDFELIDELVRTAYNTALCKHPNILPYYLSFVEHERLWTVTAPMKLGSCRGLMKKTFPDGFTEVVAATILREVLKAVVYLHENYFIHNDIRADNILMTENGDVKLTGFRSMVSRAKDGGHVKTVFSLVGDNIEWAAPEVMAQNANYTEKADIYCLGITGLELAFNTTPFTDWPPLKVLLAKMEYDVPATILSSKPMSRHFYDLVYQCTQRDPCLRPSASSLLEHPFFKLGKTMHYLENHVVKKALVLKSPTSPNLPL